MSTPLDLFLSGATGPHLWFSFHFGLFMRNLSLITCLQNCVWISENHTALWKSIFYMFWETAGDNVSSDDFHIVLEKRYLIGSSAISDLPSCLTGTVRHEYTCQ